MTVSITVERYWAVCRPTVKLRNPRNYKKYFPVFAGVPQRGPGAEQEHPRGEVPGPRHHRLRPPQRAQVLRGLLGHLRPGKRNGEY